MRNLKYFVFGLVCLFIMPLMVSANENIEVTIKGNDLANVNESLTYEIVLKSDKTVHGFKADLKIESDFFELLSISNQEDWKGSNTITASGSNLNFNHSGSGVTGETVVAKVKFKIKQSTTKTSSTIILNNINITLDENNTVQINNETSKKITLKSTDNTLSSIKIDGKVIDNFDSKIDSYEIAVLGDKESIKLEAIPTDSKASLVENYGSRDIKLNYGENNVEIKVLSESGSSKTYTLVITREDLRQTDNSLKTLIVKQNDKVIFDPIEDNFISQQLEYSIKTYKVTLAMLDVIAEPVEESSIVVIEYPKEIVDGKNDIIIKVTSESKDERIYVVTLYNSDEAVDTTLKSLTVKNYESKDLNFDKNNSAYELIFNKNKLESCTVDKTKYNNCLKIYAVRSDVNNTTIEVRNNYNLEIGSIVEVVVTGADGSEDIYTITMIKDSRINFFFLLELLILIALIILLIILVVKRIINNNKNKPRAQKVVKRVEPEENIEIEDGVDPGTIEITKEVQTIKELYSKE